MPNEKAPAAAAPATAHRNVRMRARVAFEGTEQEGAPGKGDPFTTTAKRAAELEEAGTARRLPASEQPDAD
jgi:hypothetical protein